MGHCQATGGAWNGSARCSIVRAVGGYAEPPPRSFGEVCRSLGEAELEPCALIRVEIWSDIVCPWCYIGKRRFERGLATLEDRDDIEIVYRAYQLNPAMPRGEVRDHRDNLMTKYGLSEGQAAAMQQQMERTAAAEGLEFHLVGGVTGNTFDAHRLVHLGRERGVQDAVIERLFRAHFTEQRSIFDEASLVTLAGEAGLDR